jgi:pilus assembly protein CpaB
MTSKRTVVVAVAVAVGVLASVLSYVFLNNAQNNAFHNAKLVSAYVITKPIPRTLSGADAVSGDYVQQKKMPAEFRPASAVTNLSVIRDESAGTNLPAGEIVVSGMFVSPDSIASVAAETVPQGDVAISVSVDQVHGVAGLIQPGDKVDILVDLSGNQETYLYQAVPVLAVGTTLVPAPGTTTAAAQTAPATQASNVITFAVTPAAAARIALANSNGGGVTGGIYLALEAAGNQPAGPTSITGSNLIPANTTGATATTIIGSNLVPASSTGTTAPGSGSKTATVRPAGGGRNENTP